MNILKISISLIFLILMTGCVAGPGHYTYESSIYFDTYDRSSVHYRSSRLHIPPPDLQDVYMYAPNQHEKRVRRCLVFPEYQYNWNTGYCEYNMTRRDWERSRHRRHNYRTPGCNYVYQGFQLRPGLLYCE